MEIQSIGSPAMWWIFTIVMLLILTFDLLLFHRVSHAPQFRKAFIWCAICVAAALLFNLFIYAQFGLKPALEFLTGYVIEYALSVDNLFVFLLIFSHFVVSAKYQHRVLFYGVLGAIVMRAIFVLVGVELLHLFHWMTYVFGALLVYLAVKLPMKKGSDVQPEKNIFFRFLKSVIPSVPDFHEEKFFIKQNGKLLATPLFFVLIAVELTDVVFAVDSIPAIFAVTRDPFIVFSSNIFAVLGLRALYFVLIGAIAELRYLNIGLAIVLGFIGLKMLVADFYDISVGVSLLVVLAVLATSVIASLIADRRE